MATTISTSQDPLSRLSGNFSVESFKSDTTFFTGNPQLQNLSADISIISAPKEQINKSNAASIPDSDLWNQFEQFRKWQDSLVTSSPPAPVSNVPMASSTLSSRSMASTPLVRHTINLSKKFNRRSLPINQKNILTNISNQTLN